jgi:hypothetical protein
MRSKACFFLSHFLSPIEKLTISTQSIWTSDSDFNQVLFIHILL